MSTENIKRFYALLQADRELEKEALSLQTRFDDQEKVISEFIALAKRNGLDFTVEEFIAYVFEHGKETKE